jgi:hypothetical protein
VYIYNKESYCSYRQEAAAYGLILKDLSGNERSEDYVLMLDEKAAERYLVRTSKRKSREKKPAVLQIPPWQFRNSILGLAELLRGMQIRGRLYVPYIRGRREAAYRMREYVEKFTMVFGKHSYRHVTSFRDFIKLWRTLGPATRKAWATTIKEHRAVNCLLDWLDAEAKVKLPRQINLGKLMAARTTDVFQPRRKRQLRKAGDSSHGGDCPEGARSD